MTDKLEQLIRACIAAKKGDKEFALFYYDHDDTWLADCGNDGPVGLGEMPGTYRGEGKTPIEAVTTLLHNIRTGKRNDT